MTPLQEEWILALESGEYKQAQNALRIPTVGFCCLGVACDLLVKHGPEYSWNNHGAFIDNGEMFICCAPETLITEFSLQQDMISHLMTMNDYENKSFKEIATYLRSIL